MQDFEVAILYWFYKEPEVTKNHLELIKKHNPTRKIYGLFGGEPDESNSYKELLGDMLDDFWTYNGTYGSDSNSKWIHGDLMLLDWYQKRGQNLSWDSISILQWDFLLFDDVMNITPGIKKGQLFFSGYRTLDQAVEDRWTWTKPDGNYRSDFLEFKEFVGNKYNYRDRLKCCLFIYEVLTKRYFEEYGKIDNKKIGMLEYKNPTLAKIFGHDIFDYNVGVYWKDTRQSTDTSPLNAMKVMLPENFIRSELAKEDGWRMFHPYDKSWNL